MARTAVALHPGADNWGLRSEMRGGKGVLGGVIGGITSYCGFGVVM